MGNLHNKAFLQAIIEDPDDHTPRLVYADWLAEQGEAERAELIRVQIELARGVRGVRADQIATQLYLIARQAVTNALKHAQARNIRISLEEVDSSVTRRVQDEGIGFPELPFDSGGMGLKIMHYRAGLMNAYPSIDAAQPAGVIVTCACNKGTPHDQKQGPATEPAGQGADH